MAATSAWSSLSCAARAIQSTQTERNVDTINPGTNPAALTRGALRNALNLFRNSCGTVLGFNPEKHAAAASDMQTGTHMSRHTDPALPLAARHKHIVAPSVYL